MDGAGKYQDVGVSRFNDAIIGKFLFEELQMQIRGNDFHQLLLHQTPVSKRAETALKTWRCMSA